MMMKQLKIHDVKEEFGAVKLPFSCFRSHSRSRSLCSLMRKRRRRREKIVAIKVSIDERFAWQ